MSTRQVDIKSFIIGVLVSAVIFLTLGAKQATRADLCARYQVSVGVSRAMIIDTQTGKIWEKYITPNSGPGGKDFNGPKQ
jgi:hypothetical protein